MNKRKLKEIANVYNGNSINAKTKAEKYCFNVPAWNYIGTKDIDFDGTVNYDTGVKIPFEEKGFKIAPTNCVFVCSEGGSAGKKTAHITQEVCFGNKLYAIVNDKNLFVSKYIYYYTRYREFFEQFKALMSGIIGGVSSKKFGEIEIPLPSLQEQQCIVTKIEELFSKLDKGVEELNKTKEQLKIYRQAVLKEAFSDNVEYKPLNTISSSQLGKMLDKNKNKGTYRPYLRNINVRWMNFDLYELLDMRVEEAELEKYTVTKGDLLMCEGGEPGRCAIWNMDYDICYQKAIHRIRFDNNINPKFYMYYFYYIAQIGELSKHFTGTGIKHLTGESLKKIFVPVIDTVSQDTIVKNIEQKLSVCDKIEQTVNESLQKAESLRQSILKQAFEGNLV